MYLFMDNTAYTQSHTHIFIYTCIYRGYLKVLEQAKKEMILIIDFSFWMLKKHEKHCAMLLMKYCAMLYMK